MTTVDPVGRVLRWVAAVVGVAGVVVLVVGVVGEARRAPRPITGPVLTEAVSDAVRSAPVPGGSCGRRRGAVWGCEVPDHDGSGGAAYDVVLRERCWRATLVDDHSEARDMPRRASGCVPRR